MKFNSHFIRGVSVAGFVAAMALSAHGQIISSALATYNFYGYNGTGPDPETAAPTTNSTIMASDLTRSASAADPTYIANTFAFDGADQSTLAGAISAGRYISFTVTPTSHSVVLTSLSFYGFARNNGSTFALTSSGGSTVYATTSVAAGDPNSNQALTLDFTSPTSEGARIFTATTFDIYFYGNTSYYNENGFGNGANTVGFTINGGPIPEPGTYVLFGAGMLLLLVTARRRVLAQW